MQEDVEQIYNRYFPRETAAQTPTQQPLTPEGLISAIPHVPEPSAIPVFQMNGLNAVPANVGGAQWDNQTIPAIGTQANHNALRTQVIALLRQAQPALYNNATQLPNQVNIQSQGPFLFAQNANCQTEGERDRTEIANLIVQCVYGYRIYKSIKRARTRRDEITAEDREILRRLSYLSLILKGKVPNPHIDIAEVKQELTSIAQDEVQLCSDALSLETQYNPQSLQTDIKYGIDLAWLNNLQIGFQNYHDFLSKQIRRMGNFKRIRVMDLTYALTDAIKLISQKQQDITIGEIRAVRNATKLIDALLQNIKLSITNEQFDANDPATDDDIRRAMLTSLTDKSRLVYTSMVKSLGNILRKAVSEYESKAREPDLMGGDPSVSLSKYVDVIKCVEDTQQVVEGLSEDLREYGVQAVNNKSCTEMGKLAAVVAKLGHMR